MTILGNLMSEFKLPFQIPHGHQRVGRLDRRWHCLPHEQERNRELRAGQTGAGRIRSTSLD